MLKKTIKILLLLYNGQVFTSINGTTKCKGHAVVGEKYCNAHISYSDNTFANFLSKELYKYKRLHPELTHKQVLEDLAGIWRLRK